MTLVKIAVGVDFSPESERAVAHAMEIARHAGASLLLLHVGVVPDAGPEDAWRAVLRERLDDDRRSLEDLRVRLSGQGVEISHAVVDGFADTGLSDAARELGADLVVVGTHGRTGYKRLVLGSVAEKTARLASSSVLVVRGEARPGGYSRIVLGTDYSPLADQAFLAALDVAAPGAEIRAIHAWNGPYIGYDLSVSMFEGLREAAELDAGRQYQRLLALAGSSDVTVRLELSGLTPVAALEEASANADLVVVGSHGWRGVRRLLLGSVAEATIRHARCSVLVARA